MHTENRPTPSSDALSTRLRETTHEIHGHVEGASFVKSLFQGTCSERSYTLFLWALSEVYAVLEAEMNEHRAQPQVSAVYFPELFRSEALSRDLKAWNTDLTLEIPAPLKVAAARYTDRLKEISKTQPGLLVAHAYVRYLGDLSGGRMLGRVLTRRMPKADGFNFYEYAIADQDAMKTKYRARLDEIGLSWSQGQEALCAEAKEAFRLNGALFVALSEQS